MLLYGGDALLGGREALLDRGEALNPFLNCRQSEPSL